MTVQNYGYYTLHPVLMSTSCSIKVEENSPRLLKVCRQVMFYGTCLKVVFNKKRVFLRIKLVA